VVLGSDACAISRFVDMVRIMYLAACGHKDARTDPTIIGAHRALEMASVNAARSLLWEDEIGSLENGKAADIVLFDCNDATWHPNPLANPVANLIYGATGRDARLVVIAGRIVMEDGRIHTIDEEEFLREADIVAADILSQLNIASSEPWPVIQGKDGRVARQIH
jgi:5-methylthioadenosine/S-adenosylhomocysteine deaminase